jgi:hypothetical protein
MASTDSDDTGTIQLPRNDAPSKVKLMIHHQFPGIELTSPVYASNGAECLLSPDQNVDFGSITYACFNIDLTQSEPIGILMYEVKRKNMKQSNKDAISSEDETRCIQFPIFWKVNNSKGFCVNSFLMEHDERRVWDNDKLMELARRYAFDIQHSPIEETYLMHDNTTLMTRVNLAREEECYKLEMTISKTSIKDDTFRIEYFGIDR